LVVFADSVYEVESLAGEVSLLFSDLSVGFSSSLVYSIISMQVQTEAQLVIAESTIAAIERSGRIELGVVWWLSGLGCWWIKFWLFKV
jgi:hypothetical protein